MKTMTCTTELRKRKNLARWRIHRQERSARPGEYRVVSYELSFDEGIHEARWYRKPPPLVALPRQGFVLSNNATKPHRDARDLGQRCRSSRDDGLGDLG